MSDMSSVGRTWADVRKELLTPEEIAELCRDLLSDDEKRGAMHDALVQMQKKPAAAAICDCLE